MGNQLTKVNYKSRKMVTAEGVPEISTRVDIRRQTLIGILLERVNTAAQGPQYIPQSMRYCLLKGMPGGIPISNYFSCVISTSKIDPTKYTSLLTVFQYRLAFKGIEMDFVSTIFL